jgi:hypothetical protein
MYNSNNSTLANLSGNYGSLYGGLVNGQSGANGNFLTNTTNNNSNYATQMGGAYNDIGNAGSAGDIASANAYANYLNSLTGGAASIFGYAAGAKK